MEKKKNEENNSRCPLNGNRLRCLSPIILETSPDVATAGNQLTAELFSETFHPLKRLTVGVRLNDTTRANKHARKKTFFFLVNIAQLVSTRILSSNARCCENYVAWQRLLWELRLVYIYI